MEGVKNVYSLVLTEICVNYVTGPERLRRLPSLHVNVAVDVTRMWTLTHVKVSWNINKVTPECACAHTHTHNKHNKVKKKILRKSKNPINPFLVVSTFY